MSVSINKRYSVEWLNRGKKLSIEDDEASAVARFTLLYIALVIFAKWNRLFSDPGSEGHHAYLEIDWNEFERRYEDYYRNLYTLGLSNYVEAVRDALRLCPVQTVDKYNNSRYVRIDPEKLATHIKFLQTLRNNLFHGGGKEMMIPRDKQLLNVGSRMIISLFDELLLQEQ
jgi:hypothetical protein